jgi:hypothetical protein
MAAMRAARVVYLVHSPRLAGLSPADIDDVVGRHPIATGNVDVQLFNSEVDADATRELLPQPKDFSPPLPFDVYAQLRQAKWLYRIEATEYEPENLSYVRQALLVAGEIAAMTDGIIIDPIAFTTLAAEDVVKEIDRAFDPLRHVNIHVDRGARPYFVHTHGMEKFGHPDFELHGVPRESLEVARKLLRHLIAAVVSGGAFQPGEETQLCGFGFKFAPSRSDDTTHFSSGSLCLCEFKLVGESPTPEMQALLTA